MPFEEEKVHTRRHYTKISYEVRKSLDIGSPWTYSFSRGRRLPHLACLPCIENQTLNCQTYHLQL